MKYVVAILLIFVAHTTFSQQADSSKTPYLIDKKLPFFKMMQTDSSLFYKSDLKKKKPVVIVYFSPECEHCKHFTELLKQRISAFKKIQIVMVSPLPLSSIKEFYNSEQLKNYPAIKMGRDELYFFGNYFQAKYLPFMAAYNKKGQLIRGWEGGTTIDELLKALK